MNLRPCLPPTSKATINTSYLERDCLREQAMCYSTPVACRLGFFPANTPAYRWNKPSPRTRRRDSVKVLLHARFLDTRIRRVLQPRVTVLSAVESHAIFSVERGLRDRSGQVSERGSVVVTPGLSTVVARPVSLSKSSANIGFGRETIQPRGSSDEMVTWVFWEGL